MQGYLFLCNSCWELCFRSCCCCRVCSTPLLSTARADGWCAGWLRGSRSAVTAAGGRKLGTRSIHVANNGCLWLLWVACAVQLALELGIPITATCMDSASLFHGDLNGSTDILWSRESLCGPVVLGVSVNHSHSDTAFPRCDAWGCP